jgi:hypothetical protein
MKVTFFTNFISWRPRSLTASLLCVTLLLSDLPAHAQTPAQLLPQNPVLIPAEYGRVEEVRQAGSKTIFFLQDAHDSLEAQENIASLINHLVEASGVKTVFEEGYEGPVPADDYFGRFKDSEVREKVSYYLLDQLRVGGAEYAHQRKLLLMGGMTHGCTVKILPGTAKQSGKRSITGSMFWAGDRRLADGIFRRSLKNG